MSNVNRLGKLAEGTFLCSKPGFRINSNHFPKQQWSSEWRQNKLKMCFVRTEFFGIIYMGQSSKSLVMLTDTNKSDSSVAGLSCVLLWLFTAALLFLMGLKYRATGGGGAGHTVLLSNRGR